MKRSRGGLHGSTRSRQEEPTSITVTARRAIETSKIMVQEIFVGTSFWSGWQLQRSHTHFSSFLGDLRGRKQNYLPQAGASTIASGEAESKEHLWKKYFMDSSQWVDNTIDKKNPRAPDFKNKVTGEALWVVNPSTPQWVKAMLEEVTQGGRDNFGGSEV